MLRSDSKSLWRIPRYRRLVAAVGLGAVSSGAANIALDLVAVVVLGSSATQIGLINAVGTVSYLLFAIPAGVIADRLPKSLLMGVSDVLAGVALLVVPVAYVAGSLSYGLLLGVTFVAGFAGMTFGIASKSVLPAIVPEALLPTAYSRQESITTSIEIAAPLLVGQLLRIVSSPYVLLIAAAARVVSAIFSARVTVAPLEPEERTPLITSLKDGLRFSLGNRPVRLIVASTAVMNSGLAIGSAIEVVYYVRALGMTPAEIGFVLSCIGVGGLAGTLVAPRIIARVGDVASFRIASSAAVVSLLLLPAASLIQGPAFVLVAAQGLLYSVAIVIYNVNSYTLAARLTPPDLLGRQMSFMTFAGMGVVPVASILGGVAGDTWGAVPTLWLWIVVSALAAVLVFRAAPSIRGVIASTGDGT